MKADTFYYLGFSSRIVMINSTRFDQLYDSDDNDEVNDDNSLMIINDGRVLC